MAIKYLNYQAISPKRRSKAGQQTLARLRDQLRLSTLTSEQRAAVQDEVNRINQWISGTQTAATPPEVVPAIPPDPEE